ncbi:hypothetical protein B0H16DRAFT_1856454 [Mycena metata]|uniref:Uncharacterized protein n=1 Tax=Mycena metata TaxID=1033252 RepID=A0AAD7GE49_9AGAR|nr:hypothetical protein B0H16DRAFT_1856454 [Mycena metata]
METTYCVALLQETENRPHSLSQSWSSTSTILTAISTLSTSGYPHAITRCTKWRVLCVGPEHLCANEWHEIAEWPIFRSSLLFVVTDEVHLINEWGVSFRLPLAKFVAVGFHVLRSPHPQPASCTPTPLQPTRPQQSVPSPPLPPPCRRPRRTCYVLPLVLEWALLQLEVEETVVPGKTVAWTTIPGTDGSAGGKYLRRTVILLVVDGVEEDIVLCLHVYIELPHQPNITVSLAIDTLA